MKRLFIPNRGDAALRVARAAREMGLEVVLGHAWGDRGPAARLATATITLGPENPASSYMDPARVVSAALATGCDALHPGYGFLAESPELAEACRWAGITFVGPAPEALELLGEKAATLRLARDAGLEILGTGEAARDPGEVLRALRRIGLPALIKAERGGGGRGMKPVRGWEEAEEAVRLAQAEARLATGSSSVYVERLLEGARHVELQFLRTASGEAALLGTRDCTLQRRFQKVLEEAPAEIPEGELELAAEGALRLLEEAGLVGLATVEFLLHGGRLFFLEVNPRLQVEHTVTEEVTGLDLVRAQLGAARGLGLEECLGLAGWAGGGGLGSRRPALLPERGAALEARVNAESAEAGFLPCAGWVTRLRLPGGPGVRVDEAIEAGSQVTPFYDPLLFKVVARGRDREEALGRLARALEETEVVGVETNLPLLREVLTHPDFRERRVSTSWLEEFAASRSQVGGRPHPGGPPERRGRAGADRPAPFPAPSLRSP